MGSTVEEEDLEYESDPEDAKRSLAMRRTEASDDEEADGEDRRVAGVLSDGSDDEGGVADYDDGDDDDVEEELEEEEEEVLVYDEVEEEVYEEQGASGDVKGSVIVVKESDGDVGPPLEDSAEVDSEEKKENEPFAVPTAGAFYMHDDRFRDNSSARNRRTHDGRRLWESKDERKWGHDKFEEITLQERHYDDRRRTSNVNNRGGGRANRGGHIRGNRTGHNDNSQNQVPKVVVKGRGPRRYDPTNKSIGPAPLAHNKHSGRTSHVRSEKTSYVRSERTSTPATNAESDPVPARNQVSASNLNYASPPFYPSGSPNKEISLAQNRNAQFGSTGKNNALPQGKNLVDSISIDKLYIDKSISPSVGKPLNNMHTLPPGSSGVNASQSSLPMASGTGRGVAIPVQMNYQPAPPHNYVNKVSPVQLQAIQRSYAPGRSSTSVQATAQQLGHRPGSRSQSSSPPKTYASFNSFDSVDIDAASESGKAKGALVGKAGSQGTGRGSFVYGGAQVMGVAGNGGASHGDPNFPGTPAFLPVMQFAGQHPGGMGVPAVGMAFPGYVAQPQGSGKSEMTWLPVLAGAAGALGAGYCPPYLAVDGAYTRQSGPTSAMGNSSKEHNDVNKANSELKPPQKSELVTDEYGQRQTKPRRYSEMNFGQ